MSKINIGRAVQNILPRTNSYTPLIEVIVNAIESIEETDIESGGRVEIRVLRSEHSEYGTALHMVEGFEVSDNGIGFSDDHRESFDTLYTDQKIKKGGRGFGRFVCLRHFDDFRIESVYRADEDRFMARKFSVGRRNEIIENEVITEPRSTNTGTMVRLYGPMEGTSFDLRLDTIAKVLVQRLLPFLIEEGDACPKIVLSERDGSEAIILNQYLRFIEEIEEGSCRFKLPIIPPQEEFRVRIFKIYEPRNQKNQISLVAHRREVSETSLRRYIPEFEDAFYEDSDDEQKYIVKAYVFGDYLDRHVSVERGGFRFGLDPEMHAPIGKRDIEINAAEIAREAIGNDFLDRKAIKREHVERHVEAEAPWFDSVLDESDLTELRWNASPDEIEKFLHVEKLAQESEIRERIDAIVAEGSLDMIKGNVAEVVRRASDKHRDDLVRYVAFRGAILELLGQSLARDEEGEYFLAGAVHDILFPRGRDPNWMPFDHHNLWILDERLNFANYLASDQNLGDVDPDQGADQTAYDQRLLFRGEDVEENPVTIIALKYPGREGLVKDGTAENPVDQVINYVEEIRDGSGETSAEPPIRVPRNTPAYGYIICDPSPEFEKWLINGRNFTSMPDGLGFFHWISGSNLYIEVLSWEKVLKDAEMRNYFFFRRLRGRSI